MRTLTRPVLLAALAVVLGGSASAAVAPQSPARPAVQRGVAAEVMASKKQASGTPADAARYAARETKAQELEQFKGGAGVSLYIGGTTLAIALLIVLLLVLL
jgi:hypothetical protein